MKKNYIMGLILLGAIFITAYGVKTLMQSEPPMNIKGLVGGEKYPFLENSEVKKILRKRYGVTLDYSKAGSIDMVLGKLDGLDFLWPSSQVALELFKLNQKEKNYKSEIIFNSPLVLYTWKIVAVALEKNGIVEKKGDTYYITRFKELINMVMEGKKWSEIGIGELYGRISIIPTDPTKSNSGNMFFGLVANMLIGDVVDSTSLPKILPTLTRYYRKLGYLEHSSSDLFSQFLQTGVGAKPIIAAYENQIIEFSIQNREIWPELRDTIIILYPVPTVWSAHPLIALNEKSKPLIKALQDDDLLRIAWEKHGFRTGMIGATNDPKVLQVAGIPASVEKVIPMPSAKVMDEIIKSLQKE